MFIPKTIKDQGGPSGAPLSAPALFRSSGLVGKREALLPELQHFKPAAVTSPDGLKNISGGHDQHAEAEQQHADDLEQHGRVSAEFIKAGERRQDANSSKHKDHAAVLPLPRYGKPTTPAIAFGGGLSGRLAAIDAVNRTRATPHRIRTTALHGFIADRMCSQAVQARAASMATIGRVLAQEQARLAGGV